MKMVCIVMWIFICFLISPVVNCSYSFCICIFLIFKNSLFYSCMILFFFFFQAEDGIRDLTVTGVQTCALPIYVELVLVGVPIGADALEHVRAAEHRGGRDVDLRLVPGHNRSVEPDKLGRSEERRVGKEGRSRWWPYH